MHVGSHYWQVDIETTSPRETVFVPFRAMNLPDHIEATFSQVSTNKTYFFKNNTFWVLSHSGDGDTILSDIFKASEKLGGMLSPIDAAFSVGNGKSSNCYFFIP